MPYTTSHSESGEGLRGIKAALDRSLDWLKTSEPGNAVVRWRITMSFKETDEDAADNEGMRRSGKLFDGDAPRKRRRKDDEVRPRELLGEDDDDA
jgi:hypothetical protein